MQYNIFHNDFYEELPGLSWAYRLDVLLGESPEPILRLGNAVKEVDLPEAELKVQQAFFSGLVFRIPIRYKNSGTFSITFNDNKRLDVYRDLMRLFRRSYDNREQNNVPAREEFREMYQTIGYDYKRRKYSDLSQELSFVIYEIDPRKINYRDTQLVSEVNNEELRIVGLETNDPEVVAKYTIRDCYIENIEEITFDYSSEECVEWSLKVHFNSFKVDYQNQDKIYMPEYEPDGFEMENLDMTGYLPDSESRYIAKFDQKRENDVDLDGKAAKKRANINANLAYLKKVGDKAGAKQGTEIKIAVLTHKEDADESGMDAQGNYETMAQRTEAMRQEIQKNQQLIDEEYHVDVMHAAGISSYGNGTKEEVAQQAFQVLVKAASNPNEPGSYNYTAGTEVAAAAQLVAQGSENYKEETAMNAEEVQAAFMGSTMQQMNHSDDIAGTVENPSNNQTLSYYRSNRNTVEKNAQDQDVIAAIVAEAHNERQSIEHELAENSKFYNESKALLDRGLIPQEEWESRVDRYLKNRKELTDRSEANVAKVNKLLKEHPEQAKLIDKYYKESNK